MATGVPGSHAQSVPAGVPHKIAKSASDPANLCKTHSTDKSARKRGCERRGGGSYNFLIPSGVEESRGTAIGVSTGSFDCAQDDSAIAGVVIHAVTHKIRLPSTLPC